MRLGAIELGGTKMVCAICDESGEILDRFVIATEDPDNTLKTLFQYFKKKEY